MEFVFGIKLRNIFLDNGNWWKLFLKNRHLIRISIIINVIKLLVCHTALLGYHYFICKTCNKSIQAPHSCKSRFCPSCAKKATDVWVANTFNNLPPVIWQHITFTIPESLWQFFWYNRYLMNVAPSIASNIILKLAKQKNILPGIFLGIHTFGRDLKRNFHLHLSTTIGGLSLDYTKWINKFYIHHETLKILWKNEIISFLRKEYKLKRLKLPSNFSNPSDFFALLNKLYNETWVIQLNNQSNDFKATVAYLGKYLKRPPIGETRIKSYDGKTVTYEYLDHYTNTNETMNLPVLEFISRLISHIPDKNFRNIRYYGFLSNRLRGDLLPIVYKLLKLNRNLKKIYITWRQMLLKTFNIDPILCPICKKIMTLVKELSSPPTPFRDLLPIHKEIANGYFLRI